MYLPSPKKGNTWFQCSLKDSDDEVAVEARTREDALQRAELVFLSTGAEKSLPVVIDAVELPPDDDIRCPAFSDSSFIDQDGVLKLCWSNDADESGDDVLREYRIFDAAGSWAPHEELVVEAVSPADAIRRVGFILAVLKDKRSETISASITAEQLIMSTHGHLRCAYYSDEACRAFERAAQGGHPPVDKAVQRGGPPGSLAWYLCQDDARFALAIEAHSEDEARARAIEAWPRAWHRPPTGLTVRPTDDHEIALFELPAMWDALFANRDRHRPLDSPLH